MLKARKHTTVCRVVENTFPKFFGFEFCVILFMDKSGRDLFKLRLVDLKFEDELKDGDGGKEMQDEEAEGFKGAVMQDEDKPKQILDHTEY